MGERKKAPFSEENTTKLLQIAAKATEKTIGVEMVRVIDLVRAHRFQGKPIEREADVDLLVAFDTAWKAAQLTALMCREGHLTFEGKENK